MVRPVVGYESFYTVSDAGEIKTVSHTDRRGRRVSEKTKSACNNGTGYLVVNLKVDGKSKMKTVHRLVAEAFIPNPENKPEINHIDGNKTNNNVSNLEWVNRSENMKHAFANGLNVAQKGSENVLSKLNPEQVQYIRKNYVPYDSKFGFAALARKFHCSATTIKFAAWGRSYKGKNYGCV